MSNISSGHAPKKTALCPCGGTFQDIRDEIVGALQGPWRCDICGTVTPTLEPYLDGLGTMRWGHFRRWRDAQADLFGLSDFEKDRLKRILDEARSTALNEALDWLDKETQSICLTREAARKSWGMMPSAAGERLGQDISDAFEEGYRRFDSKKER